MKGLDHFTIIAISALAYALANVVHEGLGHGGACILLGARPTMFNAIFFDYDETTASGAVQRMISSAGSIVNAIVGTSLPGSSAPRSRWCSSSWYLVPESGNSNPIDPTSNPVQVPEVDDMRIHIPALILVPLFTFLSTASASSPRAELVGLRLEMSRDQAHDTLARRGKPLRGNGEDSERGGQESWSLDRGPWGYVAFGLDNDHVRWVTAFARRTGRRIRYSDIGSLASCKRHGAYFFTWKVHPANGRSPYMVIARGTDSTYVTSVSLVRDEREAARSGSALPDKAHWPWPDSVDSLPTRPEWLALSRMLPD